MTDKYDPKPTIDALIAREGLDDAAWTLLRIAAQQEQLDRKLLADAREALSRKAESRTFGLTTGMTIGDVRNHATIQSLSRQLHALESRHDELRRTVDGHTLALLSAATKPSTEG